MKILYIAEVTGKAGIWVVKKTLNSLKQKYAPDFVIINGNSTTTSVGLGKQHAYYLKKLGADCITTGDYAFQKKDLVDSFEQIKYVLRPFNMPAGLPQNIPGQGWKILVNKLTGEKLAVVSLLGRIGSHRILAENPYVAIDAVLQKLTPLTASVIVDFASYTTAEKQAMGFMLAGKVSAVIGSGGKVQTADSKIITSATDNILKTAYITDAGRTGSINSVGGYGIESKIQEYKTGLPNILNEAWDFLAVQGVYIELTQTGQAVKIERIFEEVKKD